MTPKSKKQGRLCDSSAGMKSTHAKIGFEKHQLSSLKYVHTGPCSTAIASFLEVNDYYAESCGSENGPGKAAKAAASAVPDENIGKAVRDTLCDTESWKGFSR